MRNRPTDIAQVSWVTINEASPYMHCNPIGNALGDRKPMQNVVINRGILFYGQEDGQQTLEPIKTFYYIRSLLLKDGAKATVINSA